MLISKNVLAWISVEREESANQIIDVWWEIEDDRWSCPIGVNTRINHIII